MSQPNPRTVVPDYTLRNAIIAVVGGLLVLGFIIYGIMSMGAGDPGNRLTGKVVGRQFTPAPEEQVSFGREGIKAKKIEGEFLLEVRVEKENRTYQVPVQKHVYESKPIGSSLTFIRPPSEQR